MTHRIRGWLSTVIEINFEGTFEDQIAFTEALRDGPFGSYLSLKNAVSGGPTMGAMVEGQEEKAVWVAVECPANFAEFIFPFLSETARQSFPKPPAG